MTENEKNITFEESRWKIFEHFEKRPNIKCSACGGRKLTLLNWFFNEELNTSITNVLFLWWFPKVPSVWLVCEQCGNIMKFSAWVIWLFPNQSQDDAKETDDKKWQ